MSLKKFANWAGETVGEFTGAGQEQRAMEAEAARMRELTEGRAGATEAAYQQAIGRMQPFQTAMSDLVMGRTPIESIPGYNAMSTARREAIGDLGTGMAGTGKFFSGTTAEQASDIGGQLQNQLIQQQLQNLQMGMSGAGQMGGMDIGGATDISNLLMGGMGQAGQLDIGAAGVRRESMGDILGAAGTLAGAGVNPFGWMGGAAKGIGGMFNKPGGFGMPTTPTTNTAAWQMGRM
jgi:hypothetical protein